MEQWKIKYKHEKACRDAWCLSHGVDIPQDGGSWMLVRPKEMYNRFDGKKFMAIFKAMGHSRILFKQCSCYAECDQISKKSRNDS